MARINQRLFEAISEKTGLSRAAVYARISAITRDEMLPNNLAAIRLGAEVGLAITRYAKPSELQELRNAGMPVAPPQAGSAPAAPAPAPKAARGARRKVAKRKTARGRGKHSDSGTAVFVVHGRDNAARDDMFTFLRALGLRPIEWLEAIKMTGTSTPYVGQILDAAFENASAVVVLMTPDDIVYLREDLQKHSDKAFEKKPTGQARPNVLFEAGLAFARHPDRTILVELGDLREFSDVGGRHTMRMNGSSDARLSLASRLANAGCRVNQDGTDWLSAGIFENPLVRAKAARSRAARKKKR